MHRVPLRWSHRWSSWLPVRAAHVLVVVAVAHRGLGPSSSATTSRTERALPSSAVQLRCWSRPMTTTRLPFDRDSAACSAWSRQTMTVKNDGSCSRLRRRPPGTWPGRCRLRCATARACSGVGLVGRGACGLGSGMPGTVRPAPSILGVVGARGSRRESCSQLVPGGNLTLVATLRLRGVPGSSGR
jgi:hypothetical protein